MASSSPIPHSWATGHKAYLLALSPWSCGIQQLGPSQQQLNVYTPLLHRQVRVGRPHKNTQDPAAPPPSMGIMGNKGSRWWHLMIFDLEVKARCFLPPLTGLKTKPGKGHGLRISVKRLFKKLSIGWRWERRGPSWQKRTIQKTKKKKNSCSPSQQRPSQPPPPQSRIFGINSQRDSLLLKKKGLVQLYRAPPDDMNLDSIAMVGRAGGAGTAKSAPQQQPLLLGLGRVARGCDWAPTRVQATELPIFALILVSWLQDLGKRIESRRGHSLLYPRPREQTEALARGQHLQPGWGGQLPSPKSQAAGLVFRVQSPWESLETPLQDPTPPSSRFSTGDRQMLAGSGEGKFNPYPALSLCP